MNKIKKELMKLTGKLDSIKNDNHEINNFMSIQMKLFREMCNKMNGVRVFLSQIVDLKKSSAKKKRSRWMDDCD